MLIKRRIETRIDIVNCIMFYSDPKSLLYVINEKFVGKCFNNCYIVKIIEIIRQSKCMLNGKVGQIDVMFDVSGIVLSPGDIITNCHVINRTVSENADYIIARSDNCAVLAQGVKQLESVKTGQILPLMVIDTKYILFDDKISVTAKPIAHNAVSTYYKVNKDSPINMNMIEELQNMINEITSAKYDEKSWTFFDNLMYAYKNDQVIEASPIMDIINNMENHDVVGIPAAIRCTKGLVSTKLQPDATVLTLSSNTAIAVALLETYYKSLYVVAELTATYTNTDLLISHKNIWLLLNHIKLN
jgi:hypothetical protein